MPRFHPSRDVAPGRDFPFMDTWRVAESLEFVADPERPVAVAARVADENIGHRVCANSLDRGRGIMDAGGNARKFASEAGNGLGRPTEADPPRFLK
jgi:hypothetical protein